MVKKIVGPILTIAFLSLLFCFTYAPFWGFWDKITGQVKPIRQESGDFAGRRNFEFRNFALLIVNAGQGKCSFAYRDFAGRGAFNPPHSELDLNCGGKKYEVADQYIGNNHLKVNGRVYNVRSDKEHLLIDQEGTPRPEAGEVHTGIRMLRQ